MAPGEPAREGIATFHHRDFPLSDLVSAKGGCTVSLCLPARNEASTIGAILLRARAELMERHQLVDEIVVVDDGSTDDTLEVAGAAGARAVRACDSLPFLDPGEGKGEAMWKSLHEAEGDLIVWCDADVSNFAPHFVTGLLGPLLADPGLAFVKAFYDRPLNGQAGEGGRVTELVARPVLELLFPHLRGVLQPLAGECAGRRTVLEKLPFVQSYGVDIALVIDVAAEAGVGAMAQVDLGERVHRNRPLDELALEARAVLHTALARASVAMPARGPTAERPPLAGIRAATAGGPGP